MLLRLTRITHQDPETTEKTSVLLERDTIVRAFEQGDDSTYVVFRYPYAPSPLGYEEIHITVEEPIGYLFTGKDIDRVKGKGLEE